MSDDVRIDQLRARRWAIGCAWLFLAVPGTVGIVMLLASGFSSATGWVLAAIFGATTVYLVVMFRRANELKLSTPESRWFGRNR